MTETRDENDSSTVTTPKRKWPRRILFGLVGVVLLWLVGDLVYSRVVAYRLARWEAGVEWTAEGVRKGCEAYTSGSGQDAVLLVHGFNNSPRLFDNMAPVLVEQGFTVRAMRLPGFAERMSAYRKVRHEQWVAAVQAELTELRRAHRKVHVVAHSLGCAATIRCLTERPTLADRAVLIAPAIDVASDRSPVFHPRTWNAIGRRVIWFTSTAEAPFQLDCHDPAGRDYPWRCPFMPLRVFGEVFAAIDANRGRAAEFRTPLLMVLSKHDRVIDWRAAEQFYKVAGSTTKQLTFTEDTGHAIPLDYGWKELTIEIAEFLDSETTDEQDRPSGATQESAS